MRIDHLNLRAVGHFTDYELLFDQNKNFHLIYGPNEAGKSTALRSITHFLYGFPGQTSDSFLHPNNKLRIEGKLRRSNDENLFFSRRKGNRNTVLDINENPLAEELVNSFLNGISDKHFQNMFALDHVRLREGGESLLQSGGNLGESLFSAASGISMLRKVFDDLEKKSGDIYKKRASTTRLNKLIKEEKELLKEISEYQLKISAWKELERTFNEGKKEIEELIKLARTLRADQEKLQRVKLTLPKIARLRDLHSKLVELGTVPSLPENIEIERKEAQQKSEAAKKDKKRAEDEYRLLEMELKGIDIPEDVLEKASLIDALYREVQTYQNHVNQIPRLEGEKKQLSDRVMSFLKEMDSLQADIEKIDQYRLSAEKKATIRELCKQKPLLNQALESNQHECLELTDELQKKESELVNMTELPAIDELEEVINEVRLAGNLEESLHHLVRVKAEKELQMNDEMKKLPLFKGSVEELIELPLPSLMETITKFEQDKVLLFQKLQRVQEQIRNHKEAIEQFEDRIRTLESITEIPSEDKLFDIRTKRNENWDLIRSTLLNTNQNQYISENIEPIAEDYEEKVRESDQIADKMRIEAEKVGEKNKLLADIEKSKVKMAELDSEEKHLNEELANWKTDWFKLWEPSNITPLSPVEMREWLSKYHYIKELVQECEKSTCTILELENKIAHLKQSLITALSILVRLSNEKTLAELLSIAEKHQKTMLEDILKRKNIEARIIESKNKLKGISDKKNELDAKTNLWNSEWLKAIAGTNLTETTPIPVVEELLSKYEIGVQAYEELKRIENEQDSILAQIANFEGKVKSVVKLQDVDAQGIVLIVNQLNASLKKAEKDQVAITKIKEQLKKLQLTLRMAESEMDEANSTLFGLLKQADCSTIEELENVEKTLAQKRDYQSKIEDLEEELLQIGNGRSLQFLIDEADSVELDSINLELEEINLKLEAIESNRSEIEQKHGVVKKEFEEKIQGNNTASVLAQQKKENLLAQLANLTDQYIQLKLASVLLQKGIEHYREQNQDPIIKRASELFARLTLQSFAGLKIDYNEKDEPVLMGVRANGDLVPLDGMSDGTTDQLYLSLRIASIEKYSAENEPIPFIVDDILVHFDDIRSQETLKILLELAEKTQIIFFTHHARLVDIMQEIALEHEYQLTKLNSKETIFI